MKTLVLSTLIAVVITVSIFIPANADAHVADLTRNEQSDEANEGIEALKSQLVFHQRNVTVLWSQYELAAEQIRNAGRNHAELERDKAYFISIYQADIAKNLRVEESKRAIVEIELRYERAHADRNAYEAKQLALLQAKLKAALNKETRAFEKVNRKNAKLLDTERRQMLQAAEAYFAQSNERAERLTTTADQQPIAAH